MAEDQFQTKPKHIVCRDGSRKYLKTGKCLTKQTLYYYFTLLQLV